MLITYPLMLKIFYQSIMHISTDAVIYPLMLVLLSLMLIIFQMMLMIFPLLLMIFPLIMIIFPLMLIIYPLMLIIFYKSIMQISTDAGIINRCW